MKFSKAVIAAVLIIATFALSHFARSWFNGEKQVQAVQPRAESRIVSMAPSSCEVLYAIGLGDSVVGVSRFTTYPPEAVEKPKVGGYLDVDIEALVRLEPDAVVLLKEQQSLAQQLEGMGIRSVFVDHMSVGGVLDSISHLGATFGVAGEADKVRAALQERISRVEQQADKQESRTALLSIGREFGHGKVNSLVAAGAAGYHQELLDYAGLKNSYAGAEYFPQLTREHLITLNPEIIIDMVNSSDAESIGVDAIRADWATHTELQAVRNGRVYILVGDKHFVPGPRFVETLEWIHKNTQGGGGE